MNKSHICHSLPASIEGPSKDAKGRGGEERGAGGAGQGGAGEAKAA
jgi:hypothetical protein